MRDLLVTLIVFGSVPIIFVRPFVGILMWSWIAYMVPHRLTWDFAFFFPFAQVVAIATIGSWLLSKEPKTVPLNGITILMGLLAVWLSVTTVFAVLPDEAYSKWDKTIKIIFMTFLTIIMLTSKERIHALLWVILLSIGFYGVKGGVYVISGGEGLVWGPPGGFFGDNNALALTLIMTLPLMRYMQLQTPSLWVRLGVGGIMILSVFAIVGSYSRGAFIGLAATLLVLLISSRGRKVLIPVAVVAILIGIPYLPEAWIDRMETIETYEQDSSAMGRIDSWKFALRLADDRILGGGFGVKRAENLFLSYVPEATRSRAFHSIYFEVLGEHGYIGLGIFLALIFSVWLYAGSVIRATRDRENLLWASDLAKMLRVSLVGYAAAGAFLSLAFFDLPFHIIAMIICTKLIVDRSTSQDPAPAERGLAGVELGTSARRS